MDGFISQRLKEALTLVQGQFAQVLPVKDHVRREKDQQVGLLARVLTVGEEIAQHRYLGKEGNTVVGVIDLIG
jgi:hypothetical protein